VGGAPLPADELFVQPTTNARLTDVRTNPAPSFIATPFLAGSA
jgi:hypothetical protein